MVCKCFVIKLCVCVARPLLIHVDRLCFDRYKIDYSEGKPLVQIVGTTRGLSLLFRYFVMLIIPTGSNEYENRTRLCAESGVQIMPKGTVAQ